MRSLRLLIVASLCAAGPLLAHGGSATASHSRSCGTVTVTPNSGDFWANVRVRDVSCAYASRFLKQSSLPAGWRGRVVRQSDPAACGGQRIRYSKGDRFIVGSRSAC